MPIFFEYKIPDLDQVPHSDRSSVKQEIADGVLEMVLADVAEGKSPVTGHEWKGLSKKYKAIKAEISSAVTANLELFGDMLDALKVKTTPQGFQIGIWNERQAMKADGHCHLGVYGKSALPKRQFIPGPGETFRPDIREFVQSVVEEAIGRG